VHIVGIIQLIFQIFFAVHAIKTGRHRWIFIILIFPVVGSLIYFFAEYLPDLQNEAALKKKRYTNSPTNIKQLQKQLEITDTIQNKIKLAEGYFLNRQYQESINLLEPCLAGPYKNDQHILEGLTYSYFFVGNFDNSLIILSKIEENRNGQLTNDLKLHKAKALEAIGNYDLALEQYESLIKTFSGEEAKCRYAKLLKKYGQNNKARELFEDILKKVQLAPRHYQKMQKHWVNIAKEELKDIA
jgi:hypothetical protein